MATILTFRRSEQQVRKPRPEGEVCDIVFYTGVRYERPVAPSPLALNQALVSGGSNKPTTKQA
jgi:hypothetical protein